MSDIEKIEDAWHDGYVTGIANAQDCMQSKLEEIRDITLGECGCEEWLKPPCLACEIREVLGRE